MSLLLCRQEAEIPFHFDKLNININSEQELCYLIQAYPLACFDGLIDERLVEWIKNSLHLSQLADKLDQAIKDSEPIENQIVLILKESNYYDLNEIKEFRDRLLDFRKMSEAERNINLGRLLFKAGLYSFAEEKLSSALRLIDIDILHAHDESGREALVAKKADVYCDIAVIKLCMFDETKALENLVKSELCRYNKRAVKMRYLINGSGDLSDKEKTELDKQKQLAIERVAKSPEIKELDDIFAKDRETLFIMAGKLINNWKNDYRRMI